MGFFKKLFGGTGGKPAGSVSGDRDGMYFYVRPRGCEEVIRVRVNRNNDLSQSDEGDSYFVRKLARGEKCFQSVEMELYFDKNRMLVDSQVKGGELVDAAAYDAWIASQETAAS